MTDITNKEQEKIVWQSIQNKQRERVAKYSVDSIQERKRLLFLLKNMLIECQEEWFEVLLEDLGKPSIESYASELGILLNEIDYMIKHLNQWLHPKSFYRPKLGSSGEKSKVEKLPYGSILVISPWNYPIHLSLMPVIGALAAGNSCVLKPSEYAPATAHMLATKIAYYFEPSELTVIEGDSETAKALLTLSWDFIVFTGSKKVGTLVHQAAAKFLTPVLLELGGKNPCIVDSTGLSDIAVRRIVFGKWINAGQTCIAPDTIYVHESIYLEFLESLKEQIQQLYGNNPLENKDYGQLINRQQYNQISQKIEQGTIWYGGRSNAEKKAIEPTVLIDIQLDSSISNEEIFGPILPVIPYNDTEKLLEKLKKLPIPLVVYYFGNAKSEVYQKVKKLKSGAFSVNQVVRYIGDPRLPFGGVEGSGFGRYHGESSIQAFTYEKVSYKQATLFDWKRQYPPYDKKDISWLIRFRKWLF